MITNTSNNDRPKTETDTHKGVKLGLVISGIP